MEYLKPLPLARWLGINMPGAAGGLGPHTGRDKMTTRQRRPSPFFLVLLALSALAAARPTFGQAVSGSIFGTVTDPTGAVIPGVTVTIRDLDRGVDYHVQTISDGNYIQTHLLAGHYRVTIAPPGFETFVAEANVDVDASTRVDAHLVIGKA